MCNTNFRIGVRTKPFPKSSLKNRKGLRIVFDTGFRRYILSKIPDLIPTFGGRLAKTRIVKPPVIGKTIVEFSPESFSLSEFAAVIRRLVRKQLDGERGFLITNGYANFFLVRLKRVRVAVSIRWISEWECWFVCSHHDRSDDDPRTWPVGTCVISKY